MSTNDPSRVPLLLGDATDEQAQRTRAALEQIAALAGGDVAELFDVRMHFDKAGPHTNSWVSDEGYTLRREEHLWRLIAPDGKMLTKEPLHDRLAAERLAAKHFLGVGK